MIVGTAAATTADNGQAYSMLRYGRTFCEDLYLFFVQLPLWGKGLVVLVVLYAMYVILI